MSVKVDYTAKQRQKEEDMVCSQQISNKLSAGKQSEVVVMFVCVKVLAL